MAVHIKKFGNGYYAYDVISKYDKKTKKRFKQTKYLGVVTDLESKTYERKTKPKMAEEKCILTYGDTYLIWKSLQQSELANIFGKILPNEQDTLNALICFKIIMGNAFCHADTWSQGNIASYMFPHAKLDSQRISEFLAKLGNENIQKKFFMTYLMKIAETSSDVVIDSTGLPNEIDIPLTEFGHHGGGIENETRLVMTLDKNTKMPLFFRLVAGNINDVSTLLTTVSEMKKYGLDTSFVLMDAGYYSDKNIRGLYQTSTSFLTRLPAGRKLYKELIEQTENTLEKAKNAVSYNKRALYIQEVVTETCGYKCYAYVCSDIKERGRKIDKYIQDSKEDKLSDEEIDERTKSLGKFVLISNKAIGVKEILPLYYTRQCAEEAFGISKSVLNLLPLRTHSVQTLKGYTFLTYLSLILSMQIQKKLNGLIAFKNAIMLAKNLNCKVFEKEVLVSESNKQLKDVFERLLIVVPNQMGI